MAQRMHGRRMQLEIVMLEKTGVCDVRVGEIWLKTEHML